jgi:hypothetical protein
MMAVIDRSSKESCSTFTALLMSSLVLRPAGSKICRLVQSWSYVVVDFFDDLGMGS